jgi:hypothetical protein
VSMISANYRADFDRLNTKGSISRLCRRGARPIYVASQLTRYSKCCNKSINLQIGGPVVTEASMVGWQLCQHCDAMHRDFMLLVIAPLP